MKIKLIISLVLIFSQSISICAQIGAIARTFRRAAPYMAVSAIKAQKQIHEQQRKLTMECLQQTRHVELLSTEQMQLTLAHSTTIEHVLPLTMNLPQVDKTQKMTSGSTNGKDPNKDGCIRSGNSKPVIRDKNDEPKREPNDSREKKNKEKENSPEKENLI